MYIDLLQIQRLSFLKFLQTGINQVFDNINPIIIANRKYVFFSNYYLLKIPSQINFISINNQSKPFKVLDEPSSNILHSHSLFETLSPNQPFTTSSQIKFLPFSAERPLKKKLSQLANLYFNKHVFYYNNSKLKHKQNYSFDKFFFYEQRLKPFKEYFKSSIQNNILNFFLQPCLFHLMKQTKPPCFGYSKTGRPNTKNFFLLKPNYLKQWPAVRQIKKENQWLLMPPLKQLKRGLATRPLFKKNFLSSTNLNTESHLTYSSEFYIPVQIIDQISKKMHLRWLLLADLPIQTKRGHFIINGYPKTVIHQIVRSPGIRFKNEDNQILADIISMRGAWMGIQIVYEKNVKAASFAYKKQNKIANKPTFQQSSNNLDKNLTSSNQNGTGSNLPINFFPQTNKSNYQTQLIQNAIIKSEKINYLPRPTINLLKAKRENRVLNKLRHWPGAFFLSQSSLFLRNNDLLSRFKKKESSIQKIIEEPLKQYNKNQFGLTKHHFWHCPFWSAIRFSVT